MPFPLSLSGDSAWRQQQQADHDRQNDHSALSPASHASGRGNDESAVRSEEAALKRRLGNATLTQEGSRKRQRRGPSQHELRLVGEFEVPPDAMQIVMPTQNGSSSDDDQPLRRPVKLGGSWRRLDTLGQKGPGQWRSPRFEYAPPATHFSQYGAHPSAEVDAHRSTTSRDRARTQGFDGYLDDPAPSVKRQKRESNLPSSPHVDLTLDEINTDVTSGDFRNNYGKNVLPAGQQKSTPIDGPFYRSNSGPRLGPRRKQIGTSRSSQASGNITPVVYHDEPRLAGNGVRKPASVISIEDDSQEKFAHESGRKENIQDSSMRPPINLGRGLDEIVKPAIGRGELRGLSATTAVMSKTAMRKSTINATSSGEADGKIRYAPEINGNRMRYSKVNQPQGSVQAAASQQEQSESLHATFVREEPRKKRAIDQMQENSQKPTSKRSPMRDSMGSIDELNGAATVQSHASRNKSPQKKSKSKASLQQRNSESRGAARSPSISDIKPTAFITKKIGSARKEDATVDREPDTPFDTDADRVPIRAFYAKSRITTSSTCSLVYDNAEKSLDLFEGDVPQVVPGKQRMVSITEAEVRSIFFNKESVRVYLKGSKTDVSNGHILIEFWYREDVSWFITQMHSIAEKSLRLEHTDQIQLNKVFANMARKIEEEAKRLHQQAVPLTLRQQRDQHLLRKLGDDVWNAADEIRYDKDSSSDSRTVPWTRKRAVDAPHGLFSSRQQNGYGSITGTVGTTSKYFEEPSPLRRSSRQSQTVKDKPATIPLPPRWTLVYQPEPWKHPVVYPAKGARRVTVDFHDLERLDDGEFLNDSVLSFALRQAEETMSAEFKDSVHFFNTFFYTTLAKGARKGVNYEGVKRWTKNTDIFTVSYIVAPINIDLHWFVAIICNLPNLNRKTADDDDDDVETVQEAEARDRPPADVEDPTSSTAAAGNDEQPVHDQTQAMDDLSLSDKGEKLPQEETFTFDDDGHVEAASRDEDSDRLNKSASKKAKKRAAPPLKKYDTDMPIIITLDSLGLSHTGSIRYLKEYISAEADAKRGMSIDPKELQGMTAKGLPEQRNFCDCGVFLVGYIEQFAKDPRGFVNKILSREMDEKVDFAHFNPAVKREEIRNALLALNTRQEEEHAAKKKQKADAQKTEPSAAAKSIQSAQKAPPKDPAEERTVEAAPQEKTVQLSTNDIAPPAGEDDEELDVEPARALDQSSPSAAHTTDAVERPQDSGSSPQKAAAHEEEDDMRDNRDMAPVRPGGYIDRLYQDMPLVDVLTTRINDDAIVSQSFRKTAKFAQSQRNAAPRDPGEEPGAQRVRQKEPSPEHRSAVVPDSQEREVLPAV